ncbi:MAG: Asp/Glu racemase [Rhizobiales bacterium]|nr:aspartate/glutamate racemase family protein [Hyphomicrobiales bacterium]NRB14980.1 Asp/Glu racemase [Hyphomicrobiales bacterium]
MQKPQQIIIINPNSSQKVTDGIDDAINDMRGFSVADISCHRLVAGPEYIETQAHVDGVVTPMLAYAAQYEAKAAAFIVACFSDPGLYALREQSAVPVLGIAESAVLTAMRLGQRFGIISISSSSVARHYRYFGSMGVLDRLAGDLPLNLGVGELSNADQTFDKMLNVGKQLRDKNSANCLILGCAGMAQYPKLLEAELGIPVIEPCRAATALAMGAIAL